MTFKVNYGFQKAERDRAKQAKKDAKRREKEQTAQQDVRGDHTVAGDSQNPDNQGSAHPKAVVDETSTS